MDETCLIEGGISIWLHVLCLLGARGVWVVRPAADGRWQVEIPTGAGVTVNSVDDERAAIAFAHAVRPGADIRVLPAAE